MTKATLEELVGGSAVGIKVAYGREIRRSSYSGGPFFSSLQQLVAELFSLEKTSVGLKYKDEDGDLITLSSDREVTEAIQLALQSKSALNLVVEANVTPASLHVPSSVAAPVVPKAQDPADVFTNLSISNTNATTTTTTSTSSFARAYSPPLPSTASPFVQVPISPSSSFAPPNLPPPTAASPSLQVPIISSSSSSEESEEETEDLRRGRGHKGKKEKDAEGCRGGRRGGKRAHEKEADEHRGGGRRGEKRENRGNRGRRNRGERDMDQDQPLGAPGVGHELVPAGNVPPPAFPPVPAQAFPPPNAYGNAPPALPLVPAQAPPLPHAHAEADARKAALHRKREMREALRALKETGDRQAVKEFRARMREEKLRFKLENGNNDNKKRADLKLKVLGDRTIPEGSELPANAEVTKTWRMRNTGATEWPAGSQLIFVGKRNEDGPRGAVQNGPVLPNQEAEVSVTFVTPNAPGQYSARYRMTTPDGSLFGKKVTVSFVVPPVERMM